MRPGWLRAKIGADHFCKVLDVTETVECDVRRCSFSGRRSKYHSRAVGDRRVLRDKPLRQPRPHPLHSRLLITARCIDKGCYRLCTITGYVCWHRLRHQPPILQHGGARCWAGGALCAPSLARPIVCSATDAAPGFVTLGRVRTVYTPRQTRTTFCVGFSSNAGWNGVVFVRKGAYAPGVFRFSIQFDVKGEELTVPTVFFPPILLHPLVEVSFPDLIQPANGRLNMLPFLALAQERAWPVDPAAPAFLSSLMHFVADIFDDITLQGLLEQWVLNERMYTYVVPLTQFIQERPAAL